MDWGEIGGFSEVKGKYRFKAMDDVEGGLVG